MKLKVAFIYEKSNKSLTIDYYHSNAYRFFMDGLLKSSRLETTAIPFNKRIDCSNLNGFDVLVFFNLNSGEYFGIDKVDAFKIVRSPDSHNIDSRWISLCRNGNINHAFNNQTKIYARKFLPKDIRYHQIIFGINKEVYNTKPFSLRRKDKILLSGTLWSSYFYNLRRKCWQLKCVEYIPVNRNNPGSYSDVLTQYRAAIAACTFYSVAKYWELPACSCLTFMEVNAENGCGELGFVDGHNAIFINEDNYKERLEEFINDPDNPKWETIAANGRQFVLENYENEIQLNKLIDIFESCI